MRPWTFLNLAISLDGKLTTADHKLHGFGGSEDRDLMDDLRSRADAVMIGASTLREEDPLLWVYSQERVAQRESQGRAARQPWNVVISQAFNLPDPSTSKFFQTSGFRKIVFTSDVHPPELLAKYSDYCEIQTVRTISSGLDLVVVAERLYHMGVRHLLLEGGGVLNFSMMQQKLVDEMFLTLCPVVFGGDTAPTAVGGAGFSFEQVPSLELVDIKVGKNNRIFLHYRFMQD